MRNVRLLLWALVAVAAVVFAYLAFQHDEPQPQNQLITSDTFGGPFTLTGSDGKPFSSAKLNGKPYAIFFGFTHCPDVCPVTLQRLARLRQQAPDHPFEILFVTVDPERDGPAEVGKYAELFNTPIIGLTGSPAQIVQMKRQFGIYSKKSPLPGGDYTVDHTSTVLLFDGKGHFVATIAPKNRTVLRLRSCAA